MKGVRRKPACRMPDGRVRPAGWVADIYRMGIAYRRGFSDAAHGGRDGALARAVDWRKEGLSRLRRGLRPDCADPKPYLARRHAKRRAVL